MESRQRLQAEACRGLLPILETQKKEKFEDLSLVTRIGLLWSFVS
jgi:hypothetical protein